MSTPDHVTLIDGQSDQVTEIDACAYRTWDDGAVVLVPDSEVPSWATRPGTEVVAADSDGGVSVAFTADAVGEERMERIEHEPEYPDDWDCIVVKEYCDLTGESV